MEIVEPQFDLSTALLALFGPLVIGAIYFLPGWLGRKKRQRTPIFLLNLFLGWTFIGWVGALIWALSAETPRPVLVQQAAPARSVADELAKLQQLRDSGALTEAEYETQKARLLA